MVGCPEQAAPDLLHMAEGCSDESAPIDALLYDLEHKDPAWMIQNSYKTSGKGVMKVDKPLISTSPQAQGFVPKPFFPARAAVQATRGQISLVWVLSSNA